MPRDKKAPLLEIPINRLSDVPLHRQLYETIRASVLSGQLEAGQRLPSTRLLSEELKVARSTIILAFEQLIEEGYLQSTLGSGTFVSNTLPDVLLSASGREHHLLAGADQPFRELSKTGELLCSLPSTRQIPFGAFAPCVPDVRNFPHETWVALMADIWRRPRSNLLRASDPSGYWPLRCEVSRYLKSVRAVRCSPEQIVITSGAQQAFNIIARMLTDPGDSAFVENPGYLGIQAALLSAGAKLTHCELDAEGVKLPPIEPGSHPKLIAVSPSHQYPSGIVMTLNRRIELLQWAEKNRIWILEDDYDSEFRYSGQPLGALQGLDQRGIVFYVGTFSKVLFPSIRLGYVVVPTSLVDKFTRGKLVLDSHPTLVNQPIVSKFMEQGHFAAHIRRMRKIYERRQGILVECVRQHLSEYVTITPSNSGMHLLANLTPVASNLTARAWSTVFLENGLFIPSMDEYEHSPTESKTLLLGYTAVSEDEIRAGVKKMHKLFSTYAR